MSTTELNGKLKQKDENGNVTYVLPDTKTDETLSVSGKAADAATTGSKITTATETAQSANSTAQTARSMAGSAISLATEVDSVVSNPITTYNDLMANTVEGNLVDSLAVKEGFENTPQFTFDETGKITGYTTKIGGADTVFPFKSGGLTTITHIIRGGSTSAWTEFDLQGDPKLIYAYRNTGTSSRYIYWFADIENANIIFYGNTNSTAASITFSTDFDSLYSETGVGKANIYIRIYDGKIGQKTTESAYVPTDTKPLTLVYMY